uniref:F-box domain-containing protein n=1 Tax=Strigamia maritima TaxID=126957 RepID=T1J5R1_STRMM
MTKAKELGEMGLWPMNLDDDDSSDEYSDPNPTTRYHPSLNPSTSKGRKQPVIKMNTDIFPQIADEVMLNIFKWLPKSTLVRCAQVCKHWNRIAFDETLWRRVDLGGRILQPGVMNYVLNRGVQVLRLAQSTFLTPIFKRSVVSSQFQYLDLSIATIDVDSLEQILNACRQLKKLSLESCNINDKICFCVGANRHLTTLNLSMCEGITNNGLCAVLRGCTQLIDLNLAWTELDLPSLFCIANRLTATIKRLNLSGFRSVLTNEVVIKIIERCTQIEELDISDSQCITHDLLDSFQKLLKLNYLALSRCYSLRAAHFSLINVPCLRNLVIFGLFPEESIQALQLNLPNVIVNECLFSTIARPTVGNQCTSLWGIRLRA